MTILSMFHVKHPPSPQLSHVPHVSRETSRRKKIFASLALSAVALLVAGCGSVQGPEGWAAPVQVGESLLVQAQGGQLSLIDPNTGAVRWRFPAERKSDRPFYATPLVDGDSVYVVDYKGLVTRLDTSTGQPLVAWDEDLGAKGDENLIQQVLPDGPGARVVATPLLDDGTLYVPTEDGQIVAFNTDSGSLQRRIETADHRLWGSPAIVNGTILVADLDHGTTLALSGATGEHVWEQDSSGPSSADITVDGDTAFVGSFDRHLHALDITANGSERWSFEGDGWFLARPLATADAVYAATMRGTVYALDRATGAQRWLYELEDGEFRAAPALVGGKLVVGTRDGRIVTLDPATGSELAVQNLQGEGNLNANPFVIDDSIYFLTSKHDLFVVDIAGNTVRSIPVSAD